MTIPVSPEHQRILDEMLCTRIECRRKMDADEAKTHGEIEAEVIQQILALVSGVPDDTPMSVDPDGTKVDARTIRVWASLHCTPERTQ